MGKEKLDKTLKKFKQRKTFKAKKHAGKLNWKEDALEYQKRKRNEWK